MKKILCLFFALVFICGMFMTACKGTENSTEPSTATSAAVSAETSTAPSTPASGGETIKIGLAIPMSGGLATFMTWEKVGNELAVKYINDAGGIDGKMVELVYGDIGDDVAMAKQRFTELKDEGCVAIIDAYGAAGAPWASENKFPTFLSGNTATSMTIANYSPYAFYNGPNAWGFAKILANECVNKLGYKSFVFVGVDQDCTVDAEKLLLLEGQKIDPDFSIIASYRMNFNDTQFATIVSTIMSLPNQPDMILQQGGGPNFDNFAQQAEQFGMFDKYDVWTDVAMDTSTAAALVESGTYPYGHAHPVFRLQWWSSDPATAKWVQDYKALSKQFTADNSELSPADIGLDGYNTTMGVLSALKYCADNGLDYNDPEVLTAAIEKATWSDFTGDHKYRSFDHQLEFNMYYATAVDGGEQFQHYPIGQDIITYTPDQYLPTLDEMKAYAVTLGYPNRFDGQ